MEEPSSKGILAKIGVAILVLALLDLFYLNYWVVRNSKLQMANSKLGDVRDVENSPAPSSSPEAASPAPAEEVATAPEVASDTKEKAAAIGGGNGQTVVQTAQREIFIPIGSGSTKSGTFADIAGLEVTIDTTKYSAIESVVFEASLWADGGNGRAWAKLKNISDKNPFVESQISSVSATGEVKTSGNIPIPSGSKKYGVQAKTDLTDYSTHVDNARIKITLK